MVKIAIIEADTPAPAVAAKYGSYGDIFTRLLQSAGIDKAASITTHHVVEHPDNLPNLGSDRPDVILISGSKHNSYEDIDWINKLSDFAATAIAMGLKVIGGYHFSYICN